MQKRDSEMLDSEMLDSEKIGSEKIDSDKLDSEQPALEGPEAARSNGTQARVYPGWSLSPSQAPLRLRFKFR